MFESLQQMDEQLFQLFNGSNSEVLDMLAMTETSHFAWIPFVLTIIYVLIKNNDVKKSLMIMLCLLAVYLLSSVLVSGFVQPALARLRPAVDLNYAHLVDMVNQTKGGIHGMFSHQSSKLMAFSVFLIFLFRARSFTICSLVWTFLHSWVLLYLGYYYPFDVLLGLLWGATIGLIFYLVFMKLEEMYFIHLELNSDRFTSGGYVQEDVDLVNFMFLVNLTGIILISLIRY